MSAPRQAENKPAAANLWHIARTGDVDQLEQALARGADIDATNSAGTTPLMVAAYHGRQEMVQALATHGADLNAIDGDGFTATMLAGQAGHEEVVKILVSLGAKKTSSSRAAKTSSVPASQVANTEVIDGFEDFPITRSGEVRTLKEPPEIWDLVHENRTEFKPGTDFAGHFKKVRPFALAAILLAPAVGAGFWLLRSRGSSGTDDAAPAAQSHDTKTAEGSRPVNGGPSSNRPTPTNDDDPNKISSAITETRQSNSTVSRSEELPATASANEIQLAENDEIGATASSAKRKALPAQPRRRSSITMKADRGAEDRSPLLSSTQEGAAIRDDSKGQARVSPGNTRDEKGSQPASAKKDTKAASVQSAAPKSDSKPKPKVIPWP